MIQSLPRLLTKFPALTTKNLVSPLDKLTVDIFIPRVGGTQAKLTKISASTKKKEWFPLDRVDS